MQRLLPVGISLSDYLDILIDPDFERDVATAIVKLGLATDWDRWDFEELCPEAQAWRLCCANAAVASARQGACPVLILSGGDDLAGCVPARRRRQLRRAHASAGRRGHVSIERITQGADAFLDHLLRLHGARWQSRGEPGVLDDANVQQFHRIALARLIAAGLARCYVIRIGDRVVGAYYGFLDRARAYAYLGGFDPLFSEESPGSILIGHAIAEALREGAEEFHFLRGQEAYKYSWGAVDRWNHKRSIRRPALS